MSTLTKVLIVLHTVFMIFLCGIVVTYVGNASNYKDQYEGAQNQARIARSKASTIEEEWTAYKTAQDQALADAKEQIAALGTQITDLEQKLAAAERDKDSMFQQAQGLIAQAQSFGASTEKQRQMYVDAKKAQDASEAEVVRLKQELKETEATLLAKLGIIATQDERLRRLQEERNDLSGRLEAQLLAAGQAPAAPEAVTTVHDAAMAAGPAQRIDLKGRITALDIENALAEISIGQEAGVREKMRFHVTRGSEYLCDIHVVAVDTDKAVGSLEFVKATPQVGDPISTNF